MQKNLPLLIALFFLTLSSFSQNNWVKKKSFNGTGRMRPVSFTLNGMGYTGTGYSSTSLDDFWKYDPIKDKWSQVASITGGRQFAVSFVIDDKAYVAGGLYLNNWYNPMGSFYEYDPTNNSWTSKSSMLVPSYGGVGFTSGGKGYVCMGYDGSGHSYKLSEYDPANNSWMAKSDFPATPRGTACCFTIGNNTYIGAGLVGSNTYYNDFYCYNSDSDAWHQISSFPGPAFEGGRGLSIDGKGYVIGGHNASGDINTIYEYDPSNDTWTKLKNYPGGGITYLSAFAIGSRAYAGVGWQGSSGFNDLYMFETKNRQVTADNIKKYAHCSGTNDSVYFTAVNIFDTSNTFTIQMSSNNFVTSYNIGSVKNSNEGKYSALVTFPTNVVASDSFKFRVVSSSPAITSNPSSSYFSILNNISSQISSLKDTICYGDSTYLYIIQRDPGTNLNWYKDNAAIGDTSATIVVKSAGTYRLEVSNLLCKSNSNNINVVVSQLPNAGIFVVKNNACEGDSLILASVTKNSSDLYTWYKDGNVMQGLTDKIIYVKQSGSYKLQLKNIVGCTNISSIASITINPKPTAELFTFKDTACFGDSILISSVNNNVGDLYTWYLNGNKISAATTSNLYGRQSGLFSLNITNSFGCSDNSPSKALFFSSITKPSISLIGKTLLASSSPNYQWYLNGAIINNETLQLITPKTNGLYTVLVKNQFNCTAESDPYDVKFTNGLNTIPQQFTFELYPNPTENIIHVKLDNFKSTNLNIRIINSLGQYIYIKQLENNQSLFDLSSLSEGIYIVQLCEGNKFISQRKLIKL